jgi:hypothetical protein
MSYAEARKTTCRLLDLLEGGGEEVAKKLATDLLGWMSEADVHSFSLANDYIEEEVEEETEVDDED